MLCGADGELCGSDGGKTRLVVVVTHKHLSADMTAAALRREGERGRNDSTVMVMTAAERWQHSEDFRAAFSNRGFVIVIFIFLFMVPF